MKTTIICIIPVKNESWILKDSIAAARTWADHVIVGDNGSSDDSVAIARAAGCQVISLGTVYDEGPRRTQLIGAARQISGRRLIFSMDADELLSANWPTSSEWPMMVEAAPGTRFLFQWIEVLPGLAQAATGRYPVASAFVDDNTPHHDTSFIHSPRIPATSGQSVTLEEIKLLHFLNIDPPQLFSKHRWYKCIELIGHGLRPWEICVRYQDTKLKTYDSLLIQMDPAWTKPFVWLDKYRSLNANNAIYWWDVEVLNYFDRYGADTFRKLNIWDVDWTRIAVKLGRPSCYPDPRTRLETLIHRFIEHYREELKFPSKPPFNLVNYLAINILCHFGW